MLRNLYIKNYALFAETSVDFHKGLNILTGETGAGKSLLVGALGLLMGKRSDANVIFDDSQKCIVEATFEQLSPNIVAQLRELEDFDVEQDSVIIRREISNSGKNRIFINDSPATIQTLKQVMATLVDLHGQNESILLLEPEKQLGLIDEYAGTLPLLLQFREVLSTCNKLQNEIKTLEEQESTARQQMDYYQFQVQELGEANLQADEEENLENELKLLQNSEEIRESLRFSVEQLYEGDQNIHQSLSQICNQLGRVAQFEATIAQENSRLIEFRESIREITFALQNVLDTVEMDPERLQFIEERLGVYHRLKRKYNVRTAAELIAVFEDFSAKLDNFSSISDRIESLRKELSQELIGLKTQALVIEAARFAQKEDLENKVNALLREVGFRDARFIIAIERNLSDKGLLEIDEQRVRATSSGINKVQFMIQTNPGLPVGSLSEIASGGEVSRVMLAIKTALADKSEFPVLIFDEIDTGISGETAHKVGLVMQKLGQKFQLLSITHLPQIAARGHHHYLIYKEVAQGMTRSSVRGLNKNERIHEIAKMIGGDNPSEIALQGAAELVG